MQFFPPGKTLWLTKEGKIKIFPFWGLIYLKEELKGVEEVSPNHKLIYDKGLYKTNSPASSLALTQ